MCGLQYLLIEYLEGVTVTKEKLEHAKFLAKHHLGAETELNTEMWETIISDYDGKLPVIIKAIPEGMEVPTNVPLMTCQLSVDDDRLKALVNHLETLLTNVYGACTVATKSKHIKRLLIKYGKSTSDDLSYIDFQLHDFAQRSVKSPEQAAFNGFAHLINFFGTDTVLAWECALDYYGGNPEDIGFSVFATEHNAMFSRGSDGEEKVLKDILDERQTGIVSVVSDTFNIYTFVDDIVGKTFHDQIMNRDGVFVVRPDSVTPTHDTPAKMSLWVLNSLWNNFGGEYNKKGYKVLDKHVRCIYGDSLDEDSIENILETIKNAGFSAENMVFGCGSYLLDKHNRDTQAFAYKSSAMKVNGEWVGTCKNPIGGTFKTSKKGRMKVVKTPTGELTTMLEYDDGFDSAKDELVMVFKDGEITKRYTLDDIRKNATVV
jgi:nicotinamide phosphoribosyltransferase